MVVRLDLKKVENLVENLVGLLVASKVVTWVW